MFWLFLLVPIEKRRLSDNYLNSVCSFIVWFSKSTINIRRIMMVKKKVVRVSGNPWFKKRQGTSHHKWGFIPINWKGWVTLILLVGVNVFAAQYFDVMNVSFVEVSKFLVVFLLSFVIFILIAKRKTQGI